MIVYCPVCGSKTQEYVHSTTDPDKFFRDEGTYAIAAGGPATLPVLKCTVCGHGFTPLSISSHELAGWYERAPHDEMFVRQRVARTRTAQVVLHRLESIHPRKGVLLDVGCGPGLFLQEAQACGWQVRGVEPAGWAIAWAFRNLGDMNIVQRDYTALHEMPADSIDVVCAFDVIEHVLDPIDFLRAIRRVLKPTGAMVLTTPMFDSMLARLMRRAWYCILPAHIHYFTKASFARAFSDVGFQVALIKKHTRYLGLWYLMGRLREFLGFYESQTSWPERVILPINLGDEFELHARVSEKR